MLQSTQTKALTVRAPQTVHHKNYNRMKRLGFFNVNEYVKLEQKGYLPLTIEQLGGSRMAMNHHFIQNGDVMMDPDMTLEVNHILGTIEVLDCTQHPVGMFTQVYRFDENGKKTHVNVRAKKELNSFLFTWLRNIENQGFRYPMIEVANA